MTKTVAYFGYGEKQSPEMMRAIVGREPDGEEATLPHHGLFVLEGAVWVPDSVRAILAVNRSQAEMASFRAFNAMSTSRARQHVPGTLWQLDAEELALVDNWEIGGLWFDQKDVRVEVGNAMRGAVTHTMKPGGRFQMAEDLFGASVPLFLNDPGRTMTIARLAREEFLREQ